MATAPKTDAEKVAKLREMAKDKSLPQEVRNTYLDQAVKLEEKGAMKAGVKLAKGGGVFMNKAIEAGVRQQQRAARGNNVAGRKNARGAGQVNTAEVINQPMMAKGIIDTKKMMYGGMADKPMMAKGGAVKELPKRGSRTATNMAKGGSVAKKAKK
jgi:hypothetical protein